MSETSFSPGFQLTAKASVIAVRGELDSGTCDELVEAFERVAGQSELTLDLSGVTFVDSAGMRAVIMIERSARAQGIALGVVPPGDEVIELLRTAGVIERFEVGPQPARPASGAPLIERVELELPRDPQSPARARGEVREVLRGCDERQVADLTLLTSEVVTNAVVHPRGAGQTPIGLRILKYEGAIRVEVEDAGEGFDPSVPSRPAPDRGRGLFLVGRFASRWGTEHLETDAGPRFRVWFELQADVPRELRAA